MPLNNSNSSANRKNVDTREKYLPTYEEAIEKVGQDVFVLPITPTFTDTTQYVRITDNNNPYDLPKTAEFSPTSYGWNRSLQKPAMVHNRIHLWNRDAYRTLANSTDLRRPQKQSMVGFHIIGYLIGIIILLVLIVLFVKLSQKFVTDNVNSGPHNNYSRD